MLAALRPHLGFDAELRATVNRHGQVVVSSLCPVVQAQLTRVATQPLTPAIAEVQLRGTTLLITPATSAVIECVLGDRQEHGGRPAVLPLGNGQHVMIDFSSPNIAKPFHVGHLRSTLLGAYLARLHALFGFRVTRINYLGDYGKQVGLLGVAADRHGTEGLTSNPLQRLYELYVQINKDAAVDPSIHEQARAYSKDTTRDPAKAARWHEFRRLSITAYERMYTRLGVNFDVYTGESEYAAASVAELVTLRQHGLLTSEDNGAEVVDLRTAGLGKAVLKREDGETVYLARDLAAARHRHTLGFDRLLYVAGSEQKLHFRQLFSMLQLTGNSWHKQCQHVAFGLIRGMRTRQGTAVFLDSLLDEARDRMLTIMRATPDKLSHVCDPEAAADVLGRSAVVVQDLKSRRIKDYTFDQERMLYHQGSRPVPILGLQLWPTHHIVDSTTHVILLYFSAVPGDTGPFLQYTHARLITLQAVTGLSVKNMTSYRIFLGSSHDLDMWKVCAGC